MPDPSTNDATPIKRLKGNRAVCTVTFTTEQIAPAEEAALTKLAGALKIEGFRPGKVPPDVAREQVDPGQLLEETIRTLMPETFKTLVEEHELKPIAPPKVDAKSRDPLMLEITFVEYPEVKVKGGSKIKVEKKEIKVEAKDRDRMVEYLLTQHQKTKEVDRAAKEGDQLTMDFWGEDTEGKELAGIRTTGHQIVLGSKMLVPGFEEELTGIKKDESKTFTLTFPKEYHAEALAGKPVTFHVTVTKVEEVEKPDLTDAFVKEKLGAESKEDLFKKLEESMRSQEEQIARKGREEELLQKIREATVVELAPELIEEEEHDILEQFAKQLEQRNMTLEQWLTQSKKEPQVLKEDMHKQAEQRLTLRFGIQKLAEDLKVDLSDEDMEKAVEAFLAPLSKEEREKVAPNYQKDFQGWHQLKWQKRLEKLIDLLLE